jgi:hypothetical protein
MDMEGNRETTGPAPLEQDDGGTFNTATKIGIGVGILVALVILVLVIILLLQNPRTTATIRDLFIIVLALETFVIGTLLVILVYQLVALIRMLRRDLKPMIESTQETLNTVKGTTTFVSQRVTKPAIAASSYATGIGRSLGVLIKLLPRRRRSVSEAAPEPGDAGEGD